MKPQSMWVMLGIKARLELEDLLLNKAVWVALLGVIVAIAKWQGWNIPNDVFITIEVLIVAVIAALSGKVVVNSVSLSGAETNKPDSGDAVSLSGTIKTDW